MKEKNEKEKLYRNLVTLIKLFSGRPLHLAKFLIENDILEKEFTTKLTNNEKLSEMSETDISSLSKAIYFVDISHMKDYLNSFVDDISKIEVERDTQKEFNDKLDRFIKEERFEDAVRLRDYMTKNNIERRE